MRSAAIGLCLVLCIAVGTASALDPVQVTDDDWFNYMPSLIERQDGGRMIVYERLDPSTLYGDLLVTFSEDGTDWTEPELIVSGPSNERHPALVQLPDGAYFLYYLSDSTGNYKIHHAVSQDGFAWELRGPVDLGWDNEPLVNPTVCLEPDGSLTMTYDRLSVGGYIAHSLDGLIWDTDRTAVSDGPINRIMRHSDGTYVLSFQRRTGPNYYQIDIFTKTSPDRVNWSAETRVTVTQNSHDSFPIELADGRYGLFYATSTGGQPYELFSRTSPDGASWTDEEEWFPYAGWDTQPHPVLLRNGSLALAWPRGPTQLTTEVFYAEVMDPAGVSILPRGERHPISAYPNPARGEVRLDLAGRDEARAVVTIFDASGRLCRTLVALPGSGAIAWDRKDRAGRPVSPGIYFFRLDDRSAARGRVTLID
ncbi:MAG: hypothetical protein GF328_15535 [Candidatus Latescibacteria bacterium]|nr:hypothetical protein [Candidatus Latescibacterota bacterium]